MPQPLFAFDVRYCCFDMASAANEICTAEEVSYVDSILEKPFSRLSIQEKLDIKRRGRETPNLSSESGKKRTFNAAYK